MEKAITYIKGALIIILKDLKKIGRGLEKQKTRFSTSK